MSRASSIGADAAWSFSKPGQRSAWPYNKWFAAHIVQRTRYAYVREHWDQEIGAMLAQEALQAEPLDPVSVRLEGQDRETLGKAYRTGIRTLMQLFDAVATRDAATTFCRAAAIAPGDLIALLRTLYKLLPFGAEMRQLVAEDDSTLLEYVRILTARRLGHSLALLDTGRTPAGRARLAAETGIPESALFDLVLRADLTRLHLMGGGMVRQIWALGYRGLQALAKADPDEYQARCAAYYAATAKGLPFDLNRQAIEGTIARAQRARIIMEE